MKKTFFISELFYPNQTSTAYILTKIAEKFVAEEELVKVITTNIQYDSNTLESKDLTGMEFISVNGSKGIKNSILGRISNAFYNSFALTWKTFRNAGKNDRVFAVTNPVFLIILLGFVQKIKNFNYILLVHDVFPENTIPAGINNPDSLLYEILLKIYNWAYQSPSRLIVLGEDMKQLMQRKGVPVEKISVIPNWFDEELKQPINLKGNFSDNITIGFAGNIGRVQAFEKFISIFNKTKNENLRLEIIGEGAQIAECKEIAGNNKNILFRGPKPRAEQANFISEFDLGLITLSPGMFGLGVPSKTYNLLAMGKPVLFIGDKNSEIDRLNKSKNIGFSFSWDEEDLILDFLNNIKKEDLSKYQSKNKKIANEEFSSEKILQSIYNLVIR